MDEHICGFSFLDELERSFSTEAVRDSPELFRCGACTKPFRVICFLHEHLHSHGNSGSYYYDGFLRTAFPKYGSHCSYTQTADDDILTEVPMDITLSTTSANHRVDKSQQTDKNVKHKHDKAKYKIPSKKERRKTKRNVRNTQSVAEIKEDVMDSKEGILENESVNNRLGTSGCPGSNEFYSTNGADPTDMVTVPKAACNTKLDTTSKNTSELFTDVLYDYDSDTFENVNAIDNNEEKTTKEIQYVNHQTLASKHGKRECSRKFKQTMQVASDERHAETSKKYKSERPTVVCEVCGKTTQRSEHKVHMRYHTGERPYVCEVCPKAFVSLKKLNYHKKRHSETKSCQCHVCVASYYTMSELYKHIKEQHSGIVHRCSVCDATFKSKVALDLHTRNVHMGEKNYTCDQCDRRFTQKGHLKYHLLQHNGLVYTCPSCNKQFRDRSAMKRHEKTHSTVKPHVCHICNHGSIQKGPYYVHMERHHGMTREQVDAYETQLNGHMKTHDLKYTQEC